MKFSIKVLMATLLFCLPMVFTSCGSDDDGPSYYTYTYKITNGNNTKGSELDLVTDTYVKNFKKISSAIIDTNNKRIQFEIKDGVKDYRCDADVLDACNAANKELRDQKEADGKKTWESERITIQVRGGKVDWKQDYGK